MLPWAMTGANIFTHHKRFSTVFLHNPSSQAHHISIADGEASSREERLSILTGASSLILRKLVFAAAASSRGSVK